MKEYYVYLLTNHNNSVIYCGITNDLQRRIWEHKNSTNHDSFTAKYKTYKLVWFEQFSTPEEAIIIEKRIKGWIRVKKINLIKSKNPLFEDLTLRQV